jgi:hypothetical protein
MGIPVGEGGHDCMGFAKVLAIQLDGGRGWQAINEASDKLVPVRCMGSFTDPNLKGSKNCQL